jgi:hypothetical protein
MATWRKRRRGGEIQSANTQIGTMRKDYTPSRRPRWLSAAKQIDKGLILKALEGERE